MTVTFTFLKFRSSARSQNSGAFSTKEDFMNFISRKKTALLTGLLIVAIASGCHKKPESIFIQKADLYPEGVEYDSDRHKFLVSSLTEGTIGIVDDEGNYTPFIEDERLISTIGIRIDKERGRLLVANSDPGVGKKSSPKTKGKLAALGIYDLKTGESISYHDLGALKPGPHFANDIAVDARGNIFVTDSFSPIIYKVDTNGKASIFINNERFTGEGFNLNGIVALEKHLVVTKYNEGVLFRIPYRDPSTFIQIKTDETFPGADGLFFNAAGNLILIANATTNTVFEFAEIKNYRRLIIKNRNTEGWRFATTGTLRCETPYVLNGELDSLFGGKTPVERFEIKKLRFQK